MKSKNSQNDIVLKQYRGFSWILYSNSLYTYIEILVLNYRGCGEKGNAPLRIVLFSKIQYSKGIRLSHVGPHALDRDLSKVFKNMCFPAKK